MPEQGGTTKGIFFQTLVEAVKAARGIEGEAALQQMMGKPQIYAPFSDYPDAQFARLLESAAQIIYGQKNEPAYRKLGALCWDTFYRSSLGRAALNLVGKHFKDLLLCADALYQLASSSGQRTVSDLAERHVEIEFLNEPLPASFHEGIVEGAAHSTGVEPHVGVIPKEPGHFLIDVQW